MSKSYWRWLYRRATEIRNGISPFLRLTVNKFRANYEYLFWSGVFFILLGIVSLIFSTLITLLCFVYAFFATTYGYYRAGLKDVREI